MEYLNQPLWEDAVSYPDWYLRVQGDLQRLKLLGEQHPDQYEVIKSELREHVEQLLQDENLILGGQNSLLDQERQLIDTAVIHHTSNPPGLSLEKLNVIHLLNIYVPYYSNPTIKGEESLRGQALASNHYLNNKMTFIGYHWLVRMNGEVIRTLDDGAIGWHAGDWSTNCRSVGICLDNDYEHSAPEQLVLETVAQLIRETYPNISVERVIGHCEVNTKTTCPGDRFLPSWKGKLLNLMST